MSDDRSPKTSLHKTEQCNLSRTQAQRLINKRIPRPDWKSSDARQKQVVSVAKRTLSACPESMYELTEIRNKKQKEVAQEMGLSPPTVMDKCGRQLYGEYVSLPNNKYQQAFDKMLWEIYKDIDC